MLNLASHAHVAQIGEHLIFLDLKHDGYTYVGPDDAERLRAADALPEGMVDQDRPADGDIVADLAGQGLIADGPGARRFAVTQGVAAVSELPRLIGPHRPRPGAGQVVAFAVATLSARAMLKGLSLERVVARVARRRRTAPPPDRARLIRQVELYRQLKPLAFSRAGNCLLDSLSLINFLHRQRLYPVWCFGVRLYPFKAHAWVRDGDVVLDDMASIVAGYTTILEV